MCVSDEISIAIPDLDKTLVPYYVWYSVLIDAKPHQGLSHKKSSIELFSMFQVGTHVSTSSTSKLLLSLVDIMAMYIML